MCTTQASDFSQQPAGRGSHKMTPEVVRVVCLCVCLVCLLLSLPLTWAVGVSHDSPSPNVHICHVEQVSQWQWNWTRSCTHLPSHPFPCCWSRSLMGEGTTLRQSQLTTVRTCKIKTSKLVCSSETKKRSSCCTDKNINKAHSPAQKEKALKFCSRLLSTG